MFSPQPEQYTAIPKNIWSWQCPHCTFMATHMHAVKAGLKPEGILEETASEHLASHSSSPASREETPT